MFELIMKSAPLYRRIAPSFLRFPLPREIGHVFPEYGRWIDERQQDGFHASEADQSLPPKNGKNLDAFCIIERRPEIFWCEDGQVFFNDKLRTHSYVDKVFGKITPEMTGSFKAFWPLPMKAVCLDDVHISLLEKCQNSRSSLGSLKKGFWLSEKGDLFSPDIWRRNFTNLPLDF